MNDPIADIISDAVYLPRTYSIDDAAKQIRQQIGRELLAAGGSASTSMKDYEWVMRIREVCKLEASDE